MLLRPPQQQRDATDRHRRETLKHHMCDFPQRGTHFGQSACSSCRHMFSRSINFCGNDPKSTSNPCCTFRLRHNKASTSFSAFITHTVLVRSNLTTTKHQHHSRVFINHTVLVRRTNLTITRIQCLRQPCSPCQKN